MIKLAVFINNHTELSKVFYVRNQTFIFSLSTTITKKKKIFRHGEGNSVISTFKLYKWFHLTQIKNTLILRLIRIFKKLFQKYYIELLSCI